MNTKAITWAFQQQTGEPRSKLVLGTLAAGAKPDGTCRAFIPKLSRACEMTPQQTVRALHRLEDLGLIEKRPLSREGVGPGMYWFKLKPEKP